MATPTPFKKPPAPTKNPPGKPMPPVKSPGQGARRAEMRTYYRQNKLAFQQAKEKAMSTGDRSALRALRAKQQAFVHSNRPQGGYRNATPVKLPPVVGHDDGFSRQQWRQWKQ